MKRHLPLLALVALCGWVAGAASAREPTYNAATAGAVASCRSQYAAGGMTATQLWQCSDKATLAFERKDDPVNLDLYQAAAIRDEQVAALFDAGRLTKAEADALYDSTDAEVQKTLKGRREARENHAPSSCAKYADVSSTGNANCY
jgi:hypothetical protein